MGADPVLPDPRYPKVRRWPRYKLDVPIRLIAHKGDRIAIVQGRGNELNEGGMAVFAGMELRIGENVSVEFTPPYSGQPIRVRGVIDNRQGYTYGIEFIVETAEDQRHVSQIRAVLGAMKH
ncbi:MAG TPA: PilZ domain-containing protein [Clostridia bacterium]|nr:PilZ domain-containing protein [Clostridia bacterium]